MKVKFQRSKPPLPTVGGEEGEGEQIDFVHPRPDPPPSKGEGIYREDLKYAWLGI